MGDGKARPAILKQDLRQAEEPLAGRQLQKTESHVVFDDQLNEDERQFALDHKKSDEKLPYVKGILKKGAASPQEGSPGVMHEPQDMR